MSSIGNAVVSSINAVGNFVSNVFSKANIPDITVGKPYVKTSPDPITSGNSPAEQFPADNTGVKLDLLPPGREIYDPTQEIMPGGASNPDSRQGFRPGDDPMYDLALLLAGGRNPFRSAVAGGVKTSSELTKVVQVGTYSSLRNSANNQVFNTQGVYLIQTSTNKYIGQSNNFWVRMYQHFATKKGGFLTHQDATISFIEMQGSTKIEREIYEQYIIRYFGGKDQLLNKLDPMGGRMSDYFNEIENILTKYNLPRKF